MANDFKVRVVSICSLKHADVWKLTSHLIPRFIDADEYFVYVPQDEMDSFSLITDPSIKVLSQSTLGANYRDRLRDQVEKSGNIKRFGWYLQQFYKIEAILEPGPDAFVIWDADCVPVKPIQIFDENGLPVYMRASNELNEEYFKQITKMLQLNRIQDFSFVIPGFPILRNWATELIEDISMRNEGKTWYETIISTTNLSHPSGFSETETLGTWIANSYPNSWRTIPGRWERHGQRRFGYARDFNPEKIVKLGKRKNLDIISFENWDLRGINLLKRRIIRLISNSARISQK